MKYKLPVFLYLLFSFPLFGEILVNDVSFHPDPFYVGDPVQIRIELKVDEGFQLTVPTEYPESDFLLIEDVFYETVENKPEQFFVYIRFRSFKVGSNEIPALPFGEWSMMPISFITNSLVGDRTGELKPEQGQALLPGTRIYIILMLIIAGVLPFGATFLIRFLIRQGRFLFWRFSLGRPMIKVNKMLRKLSHIGDDLDSKTFYMTLSEGVKVYLTEKFRQDFSSATTSDIAHSSYINLDPTLKLKLIRSLRQFDLIKFAGEPVSEKERQDSLSIIREICSNIEEEAVSDSI